MSILLMGTRNRSEIWPHKWFKYGQPDIMASFGAPADELYLPGVPAAGNIAGSLEGNVLTAATTPLYQQVLTGILGDPLGAGFEYNTTDSFDAADASVHEYNSDAFAVLFSLSLTGAATSVATRIAGKLDIANFGWAIRAGGNGARPQPLGILALGSLAPGGIVVTTANTLAAGVPAYALVYRSLVDAKKFGLMTSFSADVGSAVEAGDLTNAVAFALGSIGANNCDGVTIGPTVIWSGANAEKVIADRAVTLPAWWAL